MTMAPAMLKSAAGLVSVGALIAFVVLGQRTQAADIKEFCNLTFSNSVRLQSIPIARTKEQQAKGLSKLDDAGVGMLFAFDPPGNLAFWMRDTRMPLSIAFVSPDGVLFAIEDMKPESDEYHLSMKPAKYALELSRGQFEHEGITVGSTLNQVDCQPTE